MTMPTLDKTWQFAINNTKPALSGGYLYDFKTIMLAIKKSLTGFASSPWVVTGSSNATAGAMDAVDRWTTTLQGANTSPTIDTSVNNVLRIRTVQNVFYPFTVTAGASTAKTQVVTDLNNVTTGFPSVAATANLVASITGTNQLTIADSSVNAFIEIDTSANGSTLCQANQLGANLSGLKTIDCLSWNTNGSAHSWIVLKQTGIHSNFELLLDCVSNSSSNVGYASIYVGLSGFTGGTNLTRPTAVTSVTLIAPNSNYWCINSANVPFSSVLHVMQSTDGECTRLIHMYDDIPLLWYLFDKPKNPTAGWLNPAIFFAYAATGASQFTANTWNIGAYVNSIINGITAPMYMTIEGYASYNMLQAVTYRQRNQITLEHIILPVGLACNTAGALGRHGQIYDLWGGNINPQSVGGVANVVYPDDGYRTHWQCDDFIMPWVGSVTPPGPIPLTRW
jgi:hypothetical protein